MGGVYKLGFLIYLYRINVKTNIDFSLANVKKILHLIGWRKKLTESLIKAEVQKKHSSFSRPRNDVEKSEPLVKKKNLTAV